MMLLRLLGVCCVCLSLASLGSAESTANPLLVPQGIPYVGVDYYPEHWPEDRWETDLRLMHEAGFNVVRVAEFSWVLFQPEEEKFDFDWLDRWLTLAKEYDMKVIVGTPTAIIPAWMAKKYPEMLSMKANGTRTVWGGRRHNCFTDPDYRRHAEQIVRKMGEHYAGHSQVVGWQIDNELGSNDCRCDKCRAGFRQWLQKKYGSLDELNRAWGTHFWGQRFGSWDEIPIPDDRVGDWAISNPSASLDWQRYMSDQDVDFLAAQVHILRENVPTSQFITHNFMGLHKSVDYYRLAKPLDFVSWDNYPNLHPSLPYDSALAADLMRGLKKQNFLIMEQTAGPLGWSIFSRTPQPGELRKICFQQLAHGADGQIWFRWRTCTVGREQYWHGLLGHDGKAGRRYREAAEVAREYRKLAPYFVGTTVRPDVAILFDYDSIWALEIQNGYPGASHQDAIKRYYNVLYRCGVNVDILPPGDDLSGYRLVLAPHLHVLSDDVANQLVEYVRDGGVLLTDCRTGVKDETNLAYARTLPGLLSPALGIEIEEYESLGLGIQDKAETTYSIQSDRLGGKFTAVRYADWIKPTGAERIARYDQPQLKPYAAVTRNKFGDGLGWYVGTIIDKPEFYDKLVAQLLDDADVRTLVKPPQGVEISVRSNLDRRLVFVINHTDEAATVKVPSGQQELLSKTTTGETLTLDGFGVAVIELPAAEGAARK